MSDNNNKGPGTRVSVLSQHLDTSKSKLFSKIIIYCCFTSCTFTVVNTINLEYYFFSQLKHDID